MTTELTTPSTASHRGSGHRRRRTVAVGVRRRWSCSLP